MKNIKLVNRIVYLIFLFAFLAFVFSGFIFSKGDIKTPADGKVKQTIEPVKTDYISLPVLNKRLKYLA